MLPLCSVGMMLFGSVLVLAGANQTEMARELGLDLTHSGLLASSVVLGLGIGFTGAGPLIDRYPRRPLFVGASLLAAAALLGVDAQMSYPRWLFQLMLTGVGIGAYGTLINTVVAERYAAGAVRRMALVHSGATLGAILGPLLVGWIEAHGHWSQSFRLIGVAQLLLAVWAGAVTLPDPRGRDEVSSQRPHAPATLLPYALIIFAYVGVETALIVFSRPYVMASHALEPERSRAAISVLWLGLLCGRLLLLGLRGSLDARLLLAAGVLGGVLIAVPALLGGVRVELGFLGVGLALGCVYPVTIALVAQRFPRAPGAATGLAAGAGALGGSAVPWITGALGDAAGVTLAVGSLAIWCGIVAVCAAAILRMR